MSAIFVKMPPAIRSAEAPSDSPMAKPRKHEPARSRGIQSRMQSMMNNSTLMSSMPMLMPASSGIDISGKGFPLQARKRHARVRKRVDPDAEPRDAVASGDADQAEQKDDGDTREREVQDETEIEGDDQPDKYFEDQDEPALGHQVCFAGFIDELGNLEHQPMHGKLLKTRIRHQPEQEAEDADSNATDEQRPRIHAQHTHLPEIGKHQAGFAPAGLCRLFR